MNLNKVTTTKKAYTRTNVKSNEELDPEFFTSNLMKILVNYLQVASIVIKFNVEWPETVQ